ncbi:tetratricopeptide repeat-containing sulfotransferase family protein [Stakelama tenebrarum]|uniref:Tetratricopeptide repeat protein n=1 Tax=Stakelama tenebrarum TaxID=2711215 RepID=A0A6G6Y465_9SPHN|nr:tetratricopeptide repeat-containing sulfotransferase family protein [Sphingosinithalassobacter tenebrarum]QIG79403.1 tetratricopeptide repeat protein [Sphingosinithalassobacter tenebrarum]
MTAVEEDRLAGAKAALKAGDHADALAQAEALLNETPEDLDTLYVAAVAARFAARYDVAQRHIAALRKVAPEYGRGWQEAGHLARDRGDPQAAIAAYRRACQYNPSLNASWSALADMIERSGGNAAEAAAARAQVARLAELPRELLAVTNMIHEGRILKAEALCRAFLQARPHHIEAMRLLADIGSRLGVLEDADFLLESAVEFEPDNVQLRLDYIQVLRKRQKFVAAREQAEYLYARDPESPLFQSHYAIESMQTGEYDRALTLFDTILARLPRDPATLTSRGHALKTMGRQEDAIASYRAAFAARPEQGDAWYALANLKTYNFTDGEVSQMHGLMARDDLALMDRVHLAFALGKAHEDRKEYAESFGFYEEGNSLKRFQTRYSADQMTEELAAQKQVCTPELFAKQAGKGDAAPDPIFILGLPRAGSTLLEQILASHSAIDGTLELPNILSLAHRLRGRKRGTERYPGILHDLPAEELAALGADYIENTRIHRAGAPFFIDKMPNNFRHIGLIHLILPNAKIIDARRDPMDCCFSGFKQLFAEGQEFTYGLTEIGRYYRDYVDLMDHWDAVLPEGRVLRVQHEDVLADLEGQVRRMLDYVGVDFEPACLEFHRTERAVRTASSEQVRRPLNRSGVAVWRHYEPWLGDLKAALGDLAPDTP